MSTPFQEETQIKKILLTLASLMLAMTALSGCSHCGANLNKDASGAQVSCASCGEELAARDAVALGDGKYACSHCAVPMGNK